MRFVILFGWSFCNWTPLKNSELPLMYVLDTCEKSRFNPSDWNAWVEFFGFYDIWFLFVLRVAINVFFVNYSCVPPSCMQGIESLPDPDIFIVSVKVVDLNVFLLIANAGISAYVLELWWLQDIRNLIDLFNRRMNIITLHRHYIFQNFQAITPARDTIALGLYLFKRTGLVRHNTGPKAITLDL